MEKIELSIIIVDYKSKALFSDCIKSIKKFVENISYEIIVVDNNQEQADRIQDTDIKKILFTNYKLLTTNCNSGFGAANNLGAKQAKGEYLLLLNPDTLIIDDSIEKMLNFISKNTDIGALGPKIFIDQSLSKEEQDYFGDLPSLSKLIMRNNQQNIVGSDKLLECERISGACMMLKKDLFDQLKGFDENFFIYFEDTDLCKRISDLDKKIAILKTAKTVHLGGKSSNITQRKQNYYKSQNYYWQKHNGIFPTFIMKILRWPYKLYQSIR